MYEPWATSFNGEQALAYSRCRHMYIGSDLDRVRHQQQVVEALANKVLHFNSIKEFQDILNAVSKILLLIWIQIQFFQDIMLLKCSR